MIKWVTKLDAIKNGFAGLDLTESALRLDHWRAGSGIDLPLDVGWLREANTIQRAEKINQLRFETNPDNEGKGDSIYKAALQLGNGESTTFSDDWKKRICILDISPFSSCLSEITSLDFDLAAAVGTTELESHGEFQISRHEPRYTITGTVTHSIKDTFNFNPGDQYPPFPSPIRISANELNLLEKCRGANQFNQAATWTQTVQAEGTLPALLHTAGNSKAKIWNWFGP